MANRFLGSPVLLTLSDGSAVEGVLQDIDVQAGTLTLEKALIHRDGFEPMSAVRQVVQRPQVKDIQLLGSTSSRPAPSVSQKASPISPSTSAHYARAPPPPIIQSAPGTASAAPPPMQNMQPLQIALNQIQDPAILSMGRKAPPSEMSSRASSRLAFHPTVDLSPPAAGSPSSARPGPSSLASNSTIAGARSTASLPVLPHSNVSRPQLQQHSSSQRHSAKNVLKKQQKLKDAYGGRRFGGAETAGSEADESHVANSEAPVIRRKGTNASLRPRQQFVTSLQPDDTEADDTSAAGSNGGGALYDDFDFSRGLASFNKQAVFEEIKEADRTDPSHRLVAHNRRTEPNKYTTKLRYDENVLGHDEHQEEDEADGQDHLAAEQEGELDLPHRDSHRYEDYYVDDSSSLRPRDSVTEGMHSTTDNDTIASDEIPAGRLRGPLSQQYQNGSGRNGPASAMLASGHSAGNGQIPPSVFGKKQMITAEGVRVPAVSDKVWKEIQQLCNIESGPNLIQRVENGARGIASVVFRDIGKAISPDTEPSVVILCTPCTKGSFGLRAGAHLVNHGASCVAYLPPTDQQLPANFESNLRLYSAAGGKVARSVENLPENADIILDALTDNESGSKRNRYDTAIAEAVSWALGCSPMARTTATPIYSIDLPSNTDPETGASPTGAIWSITPSAVIALGLVKTPSVNARYSIFLVDIGLPMTAIERAGVSDYKRVFIGETWVTSVF